MASAKSVETARCPSTRTSNAVVHGRAAFESNCERTRLPPATSTAAEVRATTGRSTGPTGRRNRRTHRTGVLRFLRVLRQGVGGRERLNRVGEDGGAVHRFTRRSRIDVAPRFRVFRALRVKKGRRVISQTQGIRNDPRGRVEVKILWKSVQSQASHTTAAMSTWNRWTTPSADCGKPCGRGIRKRVISQIKQRTDRGLRKFRGQWVTIRSP